MLLLYVFYCLRAPALVQEYDRVLVKRSLKKKKIFKALQIVEQSHFNEQTPQESTLSQPIQ